MVRSPNDRSMFWGPNNTAMSPMLEIDRILPSGNCRSRASGLSVRPRNAAYGWPAQLAL